MHPKIVPFLLCIGAMSGMSLLHAQGQQRHSQRVTSDLKRTAESRNRESMRFGERDVLTVVGTEQKGNSFREQSPALANSSGEIDYVDPIELYRRTIAMYETGETFTSAPVSRSSFTSRPNWNPESAIAPAIEHAAQAENLEDDSESWAWLFSISAFVVITIVILKNSDLMSLKREPDPKFSRSRSGRIHTLDLG